MLYILKLLAYLIRNNVKLIVRLLCWLLVYHKSQYGKDNLENNRNVKRWIGTYQNILYYL